MLHHSTPYRTDKNLGAAYNDAMSRIDDNDWMAIRDIDTMFLLPDTPTRIERYINRYPDAGLLTGYCNRIHHLSPQLLTGVVGENDSIRHHILVAESLKVFDYDVLELTKHVSGFLMVISKRTWNEMPFPETGGCVGIDTLYWQRLVRAGKKILLMKSVYLWHTYRLATSVTDKTHLV